MATMIPSTPKEHTPESREGEMFEALDKLPKDYYVFHSQRLIDVYQGFLSEHEADFVIFQKDLGALVIEGKAGNIQKTGAGKD